MALIRGGLGMAAGQSANFLDNLSAGAMSGVESYAKTQEGILEAQSELAKQKRAEDLALLGKALDMEEGDLDRASKETIAKYMSPTGPFSSQVDKLIATDGPLESLEKKILLFGDVDPEKMTEKTRVQYLKLINDKINRIAELRARYGSIGIGQTSSNVDLSQFIVKRD